MQCDFFVACARPMDNEGVGIIVVGAIAMTTNYVIFCSIRGFIPIYTELFKHTRLPFWKVTRD